MGRYSAGSDPLSRASPARCTLTARPPPPVPSQNQTKQSRLDRLLSRTRSAEADDPTETERHSQVNAGTAPASLRETMRFSSVPMLEKGLSFLRFKVSNSVEVLDDPLAGWACLRWIRRGRVLG